MEHNSLHGQNREGNILFVGFQSITAHDTKIAKTITLREAITKVVHLRYRRMIILVGDKDLERECGVTTS